MATQEPNALRLAAALEKEYSIETLDDAARELRRLHEESELHQQELASYRFTVENREARIVELEGQIAAVQQELATQHNADIGAAVMRACKELPEGAEIQIYLERGAGTVHMTDWDGNEFDHFDQDHEDFACRINAAIDGAIAAELVAAQAKQGGKA